MCLERLYMAPVGYRSYLSPLSNILLSAPQFLTPPLMSHTHPTSTSTNFQQVFDNAVKAYKMRAKEDLLTHPLADRFETCDSASSVLAVLREQAQTLDESHHRNETQTSFLNSTVVYLTSSTCLRSAFSYGFSYRSHRYFHLQKPSLLEPVLSCQWCVSFLVCSRHPF